MWLWTEHTKENAVAFGLKIKQLCPQCGDDSARLEQETKKKLRTKLQQAIEEL